MVREKIFAKDIAARGDDGVPLEFHEGIKQRDYTESEFKALPDEHQVTIAGSRIFELRHDAPEEAAEAAKRLESAEPEPPFGAVAPVPVPVPAEPSRGTAGRRGD